MRGGRSNCFIFVVLINVIIFITLFVSNYSARHAAVKVLLAWKNLDTRYKVLNGNLSKFQSGKVKKTTEILVRLAARKLTLTHFSLGS